MITQKFNLYAASVNYNKASMSSDGKYILVSAATTPGFNLSTDYGVTWATPLVAGTSSGNAISSSGQYMYAHSNSRLYRSEDYGANWSEVQPAGNSNQVWEAIAVGADGKYVVAAINSSAGKVYMSTDYGVNWSEIQPMGTVTKNWRVAAVSSDGQHIYVGQMNTGPNYVKQSHDGGQTWSDLPPFGGATASAQSMSCSSDGSKIAFAANTVGGCLYGDYGATQIAVGPSGSGNGISISADGNRIILGMNTGRIWLKRINDLSSWEDLKLNGNTSNTWKGIAINGNGSRIIACPSGNFPGILAYDWNPGILVNFIG